MKIGFIDYYLDEYHANHYPQWLKNVANRDFELYAWAEIDSPKGGLTTHQWCAEYGVSRVDSLRELCDICDCIMILSPDNPEKHLEYAKETFSFSKPVFMDKTFAPDYGTALEIIELAKKYNTPLFSSSSLRFCEEFDGIERADSVQTYGGGHNFEIESIHPIEICARLMGVGADSLTLFGDSSRFIAHVLYRDGRTAEIFFCENCKSLGYGAIIDNGGVRRSVKVGSDFFQLLTNAMVKFFDTGVSPLSYDDILEGIKIRDGIIKALGQSSKTIKL